MSTVLEPKQWYTVQEAAEILGVTEGRIRQLLLKEDNEQGERLSGQKFGRSWAISASEINRFKKCERKPGNPNFVENSG